MSGGRPCRTFTLSLSFCRLLHCLKMAGRAPAGGPLGSRYASPQAIHSPASTAWRAGAIMVRQQRHGRAERNAPSAVAPDGACLISSDPVARRIPFVPSVGEAAGGPSGAMTPPRKRSAPGRRPGCFVSAGGSIVRRQRLAPMKRPCSSAGAGREEDDQDAGRDGWSLHPKVATSAMQQHILTTPCRTGRRPTLAASAHSRRPRPDLAPRSHARSGDGRSSPGDFGGRPAAAPKPSARRRRPLRRAAR